MMAKRRDLALWIAAFLVGGGGAFAAGGTIQNDVFWKDTQGNTLLSQSGGVYKFNGTYYWYGVNSQGAVKYAANPGSLTKDNTFLAITCYSSTDLVNWKFENNVLVPSQVKVKDPSWIGRFGIAYNRNTKKYVMIAHCLITDTIAGTTSYNGELFATSSTPTGDFAFDHVESSVKSTSGVSFGVGDQSIFTDDDGKAYLVCSAKSLYVAPLRASDYLAIEPAVPIAPDAGREGDAMFKYRGRYYFCTSDKHGWNASHSYVISATDILGPYSAASVMEGTDADFSHVTQTGFFVNVNGTTDTTVIFCGDRWSDFAGNGIGYNQWCPLSFNGIAPIFHSLSQWNLDEATGKWSVGLGNNYVLNPSFEADRIPQSTLAGWTTSPVDTAIDINSTSNMSGNFSLNLSGSTTTSQTIASIPNGTYTLSAWVKSSGGQTSADLFAKGYGDVEMDHHLDTAIGTWTKVSIPGIKVAKGTIQIGLATKGSANQWVRIDDVSLVNSASTGIDQVRSRMPLPENDGILVMSDHPFALPGKASKSVEVYDLVGVHRGTFATTEKMMTLKDHGIPGGVYFVKAAGK